MRESPWSEQGAAAAMLAASDRARSGVAAARWVRGWVACVAALAPLVISGQASADHCAFFANDNFSGPNATYDIPNSGSHSGYSWGPTGVRRVGSHLNSSGNPIYDNLESVEIRAQDSDVSLYVFEGAHMDGVFQAVRCRQGNTCRWRFGSMKNKTKSFICQRDDFVDTSNALGAVAAVMSNSLIPSYLFADPMTAVIHEGVRTQRTRFYGNEIDLRRGRMSWSTSYNLCRIINCASLGDDEFRRRYRDYLQYSYRARGRLKADARNYDMDIDLWLQPRLVSGQLSFQERGWRVRVSSGIWSNFIRDQIADQVREQYQGLGARITNDVTSMVRGLLGTNVGNTILRNNTRLVFSHPCQYFLQRVGNPDHTYTSFQIENICGGTTPSVVASPGLRLLK